MSADEDEDDLDMSMNFMFNSAHAKEKETFVFSLEGKEDIETISIDLLMIKGDPGHLQSGQYLWPASKALGEWMLAPAHHPMNTMELVGEVGDKTIEKEGAYSIVEMGSGCGLASLAMSHLHFVKTILITDYDPGVLDILNKNVAHLDSQRGCSFFVENLTWGNELTPHIKQLFSAFFNTSNEDKGDKEDERDEGDGGDSYQRCSDCVVTGADLLYSVDVVSPLLTSVKKFLDLSRPYNTTTKSSSEENEEKDVSGRRIRSGMFVLVSSFDVGELINKEVALVCQILGFSVRDVRALDLSDSMNPVYRVQYFSPIL